MLPLRRPFYWIMSKSNPDRLFVDVSPKTDGQKAFISLGGQFPSPSRTLLGGERERGARSRARSPQSAGPRSISRASFGHAEREGEEQTWPRLSGLSRLGASTISHPASIAIFVYGIIKRLRSRFMSSWTSPTSEAISSLTPAPPPPSFNSRPRPSPGRGLTGLRTRTRAYLPHGPGAR